MDPCGPSMVRDCSNDTTPCAAASIPHCLAFCLRSLQTLCSWFITQKYTSKTVPSHRQIQQVLVDLGDKDKGFVGSNKWIGATELMYVLDTYMGISSKVGGSHSCLLVMPACDVGTQRALYTVCS
jgi:hypothetical protein